jgi:hypothetical protein
VRATRFQVMMNRPELTVRQRQTRTLHVSRRACVHSRFSFVCPVESASGFIIASSMLLCHVDASSRRSAVSYRPHPSPHPLTFPLHSAVSIKSAGAIGNGLISSRPVVGYHRESSRRDVLWVICGDVAAEQDAWKNFGSHGCCLWRGLARRLVVLRIVIQHVSNATTAAATAPLPLPLPHSTPPPPPLIS